MKKIKNTKERDKKKVRLKFIILFFMMVVIGGRVYLVNAGIHDSTLEKNQVDDIYAVVNLDGKVRFFYLNMYRMNGRVSYCIDLGVDITSGIYHSTNDFLISNLSIDQIEYIRSISAFGYQYLNHDDYRYYMAAQEIIWEYLSGIDIYWTNVLDANGERINVDLYKNEILEMRGNYYKEVMFSFGDGYEYTNGDKIVLEDLAGVLADYEIVDSGNSKAYIDGNKLIIDVSNDYLGEEEIIIRKKKYYNYDSLLYYYYSSQKLISDGNFKDIISKINFKIVKRKMDVQVVDSKTKVNIPLGQATLEGALYELYNDNGDYIGNYTTDLNGGFFVDNLDYGNYYFKQIKASEGYLINENIIPISFFDNHEKIELEQDVISNFVLINKVYGDSYEPEEGIRFKVVDIEGNYYEEIVTDKDGMASVWLPYGRYIISQDNSKYGYSKVDSFNVNILEYNEDKLSYNLVNDLIQYQVRLKTKLMDSNNLILVDGFVYKVKDKAKNNYMEFEGRSEFISDSSGVVTFPMLFSYGDYVIEQILVPDGVVLNSEVMEFSINNETIINNSELGDYIEVSFYNKFVMGNLEVDVKKEILSNNNYSYEVVPDELREFFLIANSDIIINNNKLYNEKDKIMELVTDNNGVIKVDNLYLGDYCLVDKNTLEENCFSIDSESNFDEYVNKKIEIINLLEKRDFYVINKDEFGNYLSGTVFDIYNKDGDIIYTGITNNKGKIRINNLVIDSYCVVQKRIDDRFILIEDDKCIDLRDDNSIYFINKEINNKKISVPNTYSSGVNNEGLLIISSIFLMGIGIFVYKNIFNSN